MTLNELDQLLLDWQRKLDLAGQNLLTLQNLPTYQRLAGEGGFCKATLSGLTAKVAEPMLQSMHDLFQQYDLLAQTIDRALFLRRQINPLWGSDPRQQNVLDILQGKSIHIAQAELSVAQIGLLSHPDQSYFVTPTSLLTTMQATFDWLRDQLLAIDQAWENLEPKLLKVQDKIRALEAEGADLSLAKAQLLPLQDRVFADPLGVEAEFEQQILPLIERVQQQFRQAKAAQQQLEADLQQARSQWRQLQTLDQQSRSLQAEASQAIQATPQQPSVQLVALEQWLLRLELRFLEGAKAAVRVGLQNWMQQAAQAITSLEAAISTQQLLLQQRQELAGRLNALQAKAAARGLAGDGTLRHFATEAGEILAQPPVDLKSLEALVGGYERWLNRDR
ncbi:MAG: hypothetical protein KME07_01855 [Pegethrix bostrychoides GSE-TBD4-15B]|uniref:Uncharacterized protein n=1 Tax=Pegethrix bostrychoides GSE-TBD4-15B TaxID=2839662 RepID=A0A951P731_9CYAN|nr:hypothetical protein [Pegethrix bostrychoides GSE-TBD4-15B]